MITIDGSSGSPELQKATPTTPCTDEDVESILSNAERSAQSQLRSTSEILKLAGSVLRDRSGSVGSVSRFSPIKTPILLSPQSPSACVARDVIPSISLPPLSMIHSLSTSPLPSPTPSPTFDDSIHLPGKFGSLSSAEVKKKLTDSPVKRTELLSKLDGLDRVVQSSSSMQSSGSMDASDKLAGMVAKSSSALSAAMENAHAHANRIKKNKLESEDNMIRGLSIGNNARFKSTDPIPTLSLSKLAIDQSTRTRSPKRPCSQNMPLWVERKIAAETGKLVEDPKDSGDYVGQYEMHSSETIITHVFNRGGWTWTTEWSPDGKYLALATEEHGLAIVEAGNSTPIWKVVHDQLIGKVKNDTTHSIRAIAWGEAFIALGGTGDAVSIVEPRISNSDDKRYSFDVVNIISGTGFVGSLSWLRNSNILAIGNRDDQCLIANVIRGEDGLVSSNILHSIERSDWVTSVKFSHGGTKLAIGDRSGLLSIYLFVMIRPGEAPALSPLQDIELEDAILDIQWSADGSFLYTGGEDYTITVFDTSKYSILHRIARDRWVTFMAPSLGGSYLAAIGSSSQVSLLDVRKKWEEATCLPFKGGIPLSAQWHPKDDKYLSICGQFNDVVVYESSCERLPKGRCLRSRSSILAIELSPDGEIVVVGNENGLVTFFESMTNSNEIPAIIYETVIGAGGDMTIKWSPNGENVAITSGSTFVLLGTHYSKVGKKSKSSAPFLVRKVIQNGSSFTSLSFSPNSQYLALVDDQTRMLDINNECACVRVLDESNAIDHIIVTTSAWSEDGSVFALAGKSNLIIYDVKSSSPNKWEQLFSISINATVSSLCWGPSIKKGLQYLAFGGGNKTVAILEFRTHEQIWESVLQIPCKAHINDLVWNGKGMLCIGDDDGIVSVADLSYLKSGKAVSEMNYNWQRQGIISQLKLTRNLGRNGITSLCWHPKCELRNNQDLLAVGGTDGIFELIDLT